MNRLRQFVLMLGLSVSAFVVVLIWYLDAFQSGRGSISGMMGQMMGGQYGIGTMTPMPWYVWGGLLVLVGLIAVAIGGLGFYIAAPEIKTVALPGEERANTPSVTVSPKQDWRLLIRTSKPDERKVLEVLAAHDGSYLQKFIVKESGLSRLKTHRIISRFAERGVVTAVKSGNTNEISLADWLGRPAPSPEP